MAREEQLEVVEEPVEHVEDLHPEDHRLHLALVLLLPLRQHLVVPLPVHLDLPFPMLLLQLHE